MSFRTRLFLAFVLVLLIPLGVLAVGVRREMERRITAEYQQRVASLVEAIHRDLRRESGLVGARLAGLRDELAADNRFRLAAVRADPSARGYLIDYAGGAMRLAGLSLLQIEDSTGRILSSGHFRNEFDRKDPELPRLLAAANDSLVLVRARTAEREFLALARADSVRLAGRTFTLIGGVGLDPEGLGRSAADRGLSVALLLHGTDSVAATGDRVVGAFALPFVDLRREGGPGSDTARVVVTQSLAPLEELRRSVDAWFVAALAVTAAGALVAAAWLSSRISRPLTELAGKTSTIDLDRLDADFESDRSDEIGALSRLLGAMTTRLRQGSARLREAERRAAVGDLARQVTHDIKNGLTPIRHVLRHLAEVAEREPARLPGVFAERKGTLEAGIGYLDTLARNYGRLSHRPARGPCDVNAVAREVARAASDRAELQVRLAQPLPAVLGDPIVLRRILENLVANAVESLDGRAGGVVTVSTELRRDEARPRVSIVIADNGPGMTRDELDRAFDDFYTSKEGGTGLGLTIVRRLVQDLGGRLRVETAPGSGSRFFVELPAIPGSP
jgi:signal transduction histidine kinase